MKALSDHKVEAGLFAVGLAAVGIGVPLIALPGNGMWATIGWALAGFGLLCLLVSALLWGPIASRLVGLSPRRRRTLAASRRIAERRSS